MKRVTQSELSQMIYEAIGESFFNGGNDTQNDVVSVKNTEMFINYIKEINQELYELYNWLNEIKKTKNYEKPHAWGNKQGVNESIVKECVRRSIRRFLNESGEIQLDPNAIANMETIINNAKRNGGQISQKEQENLMRDLQINQNFNDRSFNYQENYKKSQIENRIGKLLQSMASKYVEIYKELKKYSSLNENFLKNLFKNAFNNSEFGRNYNAWQEEKATKDLRDLKNPKEIMTLLKNTYERVFRPLYNSVVNGAYDNAIALSEKLNNCNEQILEKLGKIQETGNEQTQQQQNGNQQQ